MNRVLHFWRDVEIFNIPDAPTPSRPGRSPPPPPDEEGLPDTAEGGEEEGEPPPDAPARSRVVQRLRIDARAPRLPWQDPRFQAPPAAQAGADGKSVPASYAHAVYLGVAAKQKFVDVILRTHGIAPGADELHRPASGDGWLAAFLVHDSGTPVKKSYVAASFAIGSTLLRAGRSLDEVGAVLDQRSEDFDERMAERRQLCAYDVPEDAPFPLTWPDLLGELEPLRAALGLGQGGEMHALAAQIVVETVPLYRRKDNTLHPPPEQAATFLNSFFLGDLTALLQAGPSAYSSALEQYLGEDSRPAERLDLLADAAALAAHAAPAGIPSGRWPAAPNEHLALAQQAAVYQIMQRIGQIQGDCSRGLMTVNGPPGTGKTTLLKEIIAGIVVERARRISALPDPHALFEGTVQVAGGDQLQAPALRPGLVDGTGIAVASSNNPAVQNISFDLPFSIDAAHFPQARYLSEAAALLAKNFKLKRKRAPWALVSGALGAKRNRDKVATALMGWEPAVALDDPDTLPVEGEPSSLKPWLDHARKVQTGPWRQQWEEARHDFRTQLAALELRQAELVALNRALEDEPRLARQRQEVGTQLDNERAGRELLAAAERMREDEHRRRDADARGGLQRAAGQHAAQEQRHQRQSAWQKHVRELHDPGWMARKLKAWLGWETGAYAKYKREMERAGADLAASAAALERSAAEVAEIEEAITAAARADAEARATCDQALQAADLRIGALLLGAQELDAALAGLRQRVAQAMAASGADALDLPIQAFVRLAPDQLHRRSLWVSERLDRARSELFLAALRLHEASLMANAGAWFSLLRVVRSFLGGQEPRTPADRIAIWNALFFVVPVVSTTLASFGRLFAGMGRESLGWVLIDEAGQATAGSVAGALWRAQRAVLVGDPLQIEPVVTVPRALVENLAANNGLQGADYARWSPSTQSAQTIADRTQRLGAWVGEVWTGLPLRTHRRCMAPMFEIANRIAYGDQMVQATRPQDVASDLGPSCWIDVRGQADGKVVDEEIDTLRRILESFVADWPQVLDGKGKADSAKVYVISPFRDVADRCRALLDSEPLGRRIRKDKREVDAGTVHAFQGMEASIVFMVLGSASGEAGAPSRAWAAAKPNLLNVALTRAQQRFYVIGNYADWVNLPHFAELSEVAGHLKRVRFEQLQSSQAVQLPYG